MVSRLVGVVVGVVVGVMVGRMAAMPTGTRLYFLRINQVFYPQPKRPDAVPDFRAFPEGKLTGIYPHL